jgi:hypothetical protein
VIGKSPDEVRVLVGESDDATDNGYPVTWYYFLKRTLNPANGRSDRSARVVFGNERVTAVHFLR